jgi:hypothetical protein
MGFERFLKTHHYDLKLSKLTVIVVLDRLANLPQAAFW